MGHAVRRDGGKRKWKPAIVVMNAKPDNISATLVDQLSSFNDKLESKVDDVQMLAEMQDGIGRLLASDGTSEAEVRRVLQDRYDSGVLRKETFQLVKSMLDHYSSEPGVSGVTRNDNPETAGQAERKGVVQVAAMAPTPIAQAIPTAEPDSGEDPFGSTTVIPVDDAVSANRADDLVQVGSVLRDRFMLQEKVSGESMGVVYKALDRRLAEAKVEEPWVAIKVLSPQFAANGKALRALQQEAAKGRCLTHSNIVQFIDLDRDEDLYFIVMEWLDGRTLADVLDAPDSGRIETDRAFAIIQDVGKALDYAHRRGIVHADIKPGNIMLMPNGDAKLFDFGVARVWQTQLEGNAKSDPGILGHLTPAYSSMQVLTGDEPVPSDDVFSLACLLYRLIAGYRVFGPRNAAEAAEAGMKPQRLASISDGQWRALKKALSFSRVTRFESMAEFLESLDQPGEDPVSADIVEHIEMEEPEGAGKWIFAIVALVALFAVAGYQLGYLDEIIDRFERNGEVVSPSTLAVVDEPPAQAVVAEPGSLPDPEPALVETGKTETPVVETFDIVADEEYASDPFSEIASVSEILDQGEPETFAEPLEDFSQLPLPGLVIQLPAGGTSAEAVTVTLREDGAPVIIDVVREDVSSPLTLRLEEVGFSGNRSPWVSGQYALDGDGALRFPLGQERARITLNMASDPLREADQQSTLRIREVDSASVELATITVVLEDDDQRTFEAQLPTNTVAFSMSQASVRERDPAVQIDIQRFNPDNTRLVVAYTLRDVTATEGEDYFAPGSQSISFGPGQRSARLLIPLVRDSEVEGDEAFIVELSTGDSTADSDIYHRIAVMIRDEE
jgi:serine/threonine protein kinase